VKEKKKNFGDNNFTNTNDKSVLKRLTTGSIAKGQTPFVQLLQIVAIESDVVKMDRDEENPSLENNELNSSSHKKDLSPLDSESKSSNEKPHYNLFCSLLNNIIIRLQQIQVRQGTIPLLQGADQVLSGKSPASRAVRICGSKPPQYLWFVLSGGGCDIVQFAIDYLLHVGLLIESATVCWTLGFFFSIVIRHSSHRYLVFGDYVGGYYNSLIRMYGGYSFSIVASMLFNWIMTSVLSVPHYVAWTVTLLWTGGFNYFMLKRLWSFTGK